MVAPIKHVIPDRVQAEQWLLANFPNSTATDPRLDRASWHVGRLHSKYPPGTRPSHDVYVSVDNYDSGSWCRDGLPFRFTIASGSGRDWQIKGATLPQLLAKAEVLVGMLRDMMASTLTTTTTNQEAP